MFLIFSIIYIYSVPLDVFSDMKMIFKGSEYICDGSFYKLRSDPYFNMCPNNLAICFFYGLLMKITCKTIFVIKLANIVFIFLINLAITEITKLFYDKTSSLCILLYSYTYISVFLYINHVYSDIPFVLLTAFSVYLYLKNKTFLCFLILSLAYLLRPTAMIFVIAFVLDSVIQHKNIKNSIYGLLLFLFIIKAYSVLISKFMLNDEFSLPIWSYIYIGFNKNKFGFQDGSHLYTSNIYDVLERLKSYSFTDCGKIMLKKIFWTWNEGTYQVGRYAFGADVMACKDKFLYETILTKYFLNSSQCGRQILTSVMRGQYIAVFIGVIINWIFDKRKIYNVINLLFLGTFLFYCIWEIKSRYLLHLYPYMLVMAYMGYKEISIYFVKFLKKEGKKSYGSV